MVNYQTIAALVNQIPVDTWDVLREIKQRRPAMMLSELIDCGRRTLQQREPPNHDRQQTKLHETHPVVTSRRYRVRKEVATAAARGEKMTTAAARRKRLVSGAFGQQTAPPSCGAKQTALESLQGCVAKNGGDDHTVVCLLSAAAAW